MPTVGGYRLLWRLGGGGFGEVFYAEHVASRAPAAVKLMHAELLDSHKEAEYRSRFAQEAEFLGQFEHPAVPRLFAAEPHAARPWLATAYVAGPTLFQLVDAHGPLPSGAVRAFSIRVAEVLELLHSRERAHRDLNPRNVLVTSNGPHVIDFGLARAVGAQPMTRTGEAVGTLSYMPPERPGIGKGTHYDAAGDIFGLGAVALYAATGHPPYRNNGDLRAGRVDFRGVPADLDIVLRRMLTDEPEDRPTATAAKLMLRTSHGTGAPVPEFARGLRPVQRALLENYPARPGPARKEPQLPQTGEIAGTPPGAGAVAPPETGTSPDDQATRFIRSIGPGPVSGDLWPAVRTQRPPKVEPPKIERAPRRARPPAPERTVEPVWERALSDWVHYVSAAADGTVLVATADGMLTALDGHTGYHRWEHALPGGLRGVPVVDGPLLHAGSADGWLNTFDTHAARLTDRRRVGGRVVGCAVADRRVVVATGSGVVWAFPSEYGAALWSEPVGAPITAGPLIAGRAVYVADARGRLHALDLHDGGEVWPHTPELHERPLTVTGARNLVVVTGADGGLHAFGAADGLLRWQARTSAQAWACFADPGAGAIYTGGLDGVVGAYDAATGARINQVTVADGIRRSLAPVDGGLLVVGGTDGSAFAVDPVGGHRIWRHTGAAPVHAPAAAVAGGPVVVGRWDGRVCALPPP